MQIRKRKCSCHGERGQYLYKEAAKTDKVSTE